MALKPLYNPKNGQMLVVGFMSGSGSNLCKIVEEEKRLQNMYDKAPFSVVAIFSDTLKSNAKKIGEQYDIPVVLHDIQEFYAHQGRPRNDLEVRRQFDSETVEALKQFGAVVAAYAGYMSIATQPLCDAFLGINVHPADLRIVDGNKRKYTGDHAVRDAILAGEKHLRATTHIIEQKVDYGRILMVSSEVYAQLPQEFDPANKELVKRVAQEHQNLLKEAGDWKIFPFTLRCLAEGYYQQDPQGNLHFAGKQIPQGIAINNAAYQVGTIKGRGGFSFNDHHNRLRESVDAEYRSQNSRIGCICRNCSLSH